MEPSEEPPVEGVSGGGAMRKLNAEAARLNAEAAKLRAETEKLDTEARRLRHSTVTDHVKVALALSAAVFAALQVAEALGWL